MMTSKLTIAAFFVLATFNISFVVCIHRDDYTKIPIGNYYKFYDYEQNYTTWTFAKERCESDGGMMFYPNNEQELEIVFRELNVYSRMRMQPSEMSKVLHIGYLDPKSDGVFKTVDGLDLTYVLNKWASGQPWVRCYNSRDRPCSCVEMAVSSRESSINDCLQARAFICKHKPNTRNAETGELEPIRPYGYTYIQIDENYYKFYPGLTSGINWYNAKAKCESNGAKLFNADTVSEMYQMLVGLRNTSLANSRSIFLGFSNLDKLGGYTTVDGRFLWSLPNDYPNRCGAINLVPPRSLMISNCSSYQDFVCKRRRPAVVTEAEKLSNAACGVDYDYIPSLKSCYKYHNNLEHWNTSRAICQSEGGDLFHPENELELNLVVAELSLPNDRIFHAGFFESEKHGVNKTEKGRPLKHVIVRCSGGPHPEPSSGYCHCGIFSVPERTLYTGFCPLPLRFVCKRSVVSA